MIAAAEVTQYSGKYCCFLPFKHHRKWKQFNCSISHTADVGILQDFVVSTNITSDVDPDPVGSAFIFGPWIRICIPNADPDPEV